MSSPWADALVYREILCLLGTGVLVVTVHWKGQTRGKTAEPFATVSLSPSLAMVRVKNEGSLKQAIMETGHYGISVLNHKQRRLSQHFSSPFNPALENSVEDFDHVPVICDAVAHLSCRSREVHDAGEELLLICDITACRQFYGMPLQHLDDLHDPLYPNQLIERG